MSGAIRKFPPFTVFPIDLQLVGHKTDMKKAYRNTTRGYAYGLGDLHSTDMKCRASQMLRRDNNLRWTPHMEESLRLMMEQPECEGDKTLAVQVRCALISEQLNDLLIQQAVGGLSQTPLHFIKSLDGQLQEIWRTLPGLTASSRDGHGESPGRKNQYNLGCASRLLCSASLPPPFST